MIFVSILFYFLLYYLPISLIIFIVFIPNTLAAPLGY